MSPICYGLAASVILAFAIAAFIWWFVPDSLSTIAVAGERGIALRKAFAKYPGYKYLYVVVRCLAHHVGRLRLGELRKELENKLGKAGRPLGLDADLLVALAVILSFAGGGFGAAVAYWSLGKVGAGAAVGAAIGGSAPWFKLDEAVRRRIRDVCRALPQAIDLIALAMQAGLDLPGAIGQVCRRMREDDPMRFELVHLMHKLKLGHSRRAALAELSYRVPAPAVRQFVGAVAQAEKQGTPLAQVLSVQASVMRTRRSQAAEQAASRAAVLILGPLMLIFACVFIVLLGPFIVGAFRGDMF